MLATNLALLVSLLAATAVRIPGQARLNAVSPDLQKACDPYYKPSETDDRFGGGLMPFTVALCEHGIEVSEPSLIAALKHIDPEVRSLAAAELAEKHDELAKPAIEKALTAETNNRARVNIAGSLVSMNDPAGLQTLYGMCAGPLLSAEETKNVVDMITITGHPAGACIDVVLNAIEHASQDYEKSDLITVFPAIYKNSSGEQETRMFADAQTLLTSPDATTRMRTSQALSEMGSAASNDLIRKAIIDERDPELRAWHQLQLDNLLKPQPQNSSVAPPNTPQQ